MAATTATSILPETIVVPTPIDIIILLIRIQDESTGDAWPSGNI